MIAGLVLAGGESRRMGFDKALISVGGQSAALRAADWLSSLCNIVHISCRENQNLPLSNSDTFQTIFDNPLFANKGPMTGLLSYLASIGLGNPIEPNVAITSADQKSTPDQIFVADKFSTAESNVNATIKTEINNNRNLPQHLLLLGCDYQNINESVLSDLLAVGLTNNKICCYKNPITQIIDPLVAYYPMWALEFLPNFAQTNTSLRAFIEQQPHHYLIPSPKQILALRSFDFPNETDFPH